MLGFEFFMVAVRSANTVFLSRIFCGAKNDHLREHSVSFTNFLRRGCELIRDANNAGVLRSTKVIVAGVLFAERTTTIKFHQRRQVLDI